MHKTPQSKAKMPVKIFFSHWQNTLMLNRIPALCCNMEKRKNNNKTTTPFHVLVSHRGRGLLGLSLELMALLLLNQAN